MRPGLLLLGLGHALAGGASVGEMAGHRAGTTSGACCWFSAGGGGTCAQPNGQCFFVQACETEDECATQCNASTPSTWCPGVVPGPPTPPWDRFCDDKLAIAHVELRADGECNEIAAFYAKCTGVPGEACSYRASMINGKLSISSWPVTGCTGPLEPGQPVLVPVSSCFSLGDPYGSPGNPEGLHVKYKTNGLAVTKVVYAPPTPSEACDTPPIGQIPWIASGACVVGSRAQCGVRGGVCSYNMSVVRSSADSFVTMDFWTGSGCNGAPSDHAEYPLPVNRCIPSVGGALFFKMQVRRVALLRLEARTRPTCFLSPHACLRLRAHPPPLLRIAGGWTGARDTVRAR